jgi:hypothetical protein
MAFLGKLVSPETWAANIDNLTTMRDKKLTAFEENGVGAGATAGR